MRGLRRVALCSRAQVRPDAPDLGVDLRGWRGYIHHMRFQAGILAFSMITAHAEPVASPVRAAISASPDAMPLRDLIAGLDSDGKKVALDRLEKLDRGALDTRVLVELSEAYRLLGRPDEANTAAQALSSRDTGSPDGEIQSILSLAQAGDYASAQSATERGLKRFPGDKNLLALLHQVKGRTLPRPQEGRVDGAAPNPAPPSLAVPGTAPGRDESNRKSTLPANVEIPAPVEEKGAGRQEGVIAWFEKKINNTTEAAMKRIDRTMGLEEDERAAAFGGAKSGTKVGAVVGVVGGGAIGSAVCAPALALGVPYGACVVAGGTAGLLIVAPISAYVGGAATVKSMRVKKDFDKIFGSSQDGSPTQAE